MGGELYWYYVKYQRDINAALQELRRVEFEAGRYNPVIYSPADLFPLGPDSPAPGAKHANIMEAFEAAEEEGTRSILDLDHVSYAPDFCAVAPLDNEILQNLYGTSRPTRKMIEQNQDFFNHVERGQGIYIIIHRNDEPDEILFAGYSFD